MSSIKRLKEVLSQLEIAFNQRDEHAMIRLWPEVHQVSKQLVVRGALKSRLEEAKKRSTVMAELVGARHEYKHSLKASTRILEWDASQKELRSAAKAWARLAGLPEEEHERVAQDEVDTIESRESVKSDRDSVNEVRRPTLTPLARAHAVDDKIVAHYLRGMMLRRAASLVESYSDEDILKSKMRHSLIIKPHETEVGELVSSMVMVAQRERSSVLEIVRLVLNDDARFGHILREVVRERGELAKFEKKA